VVRKVRGEVLVRLRLQLPFYALATIDALNVRYIGPATARKAQQMQSWAVLRNFVERVGPMD
jgi:hypothetical protein